MNNAFEIIDGVLIINANYLNGVEIAGLTEGSVLFSNGDSVSEDNANLFWDDVNKRLGVGINEPDARVHISNVDTALDSATLAQTGRDFILAEQSGNSVNSILIASNTASNRGIFKSTRSRGILGTPSSNNNNDFILSLIGTYYDGSAYRTTAAIEFFADGTVSSGNAPQRINFLTGETTARTTRMVIKANGNIGIGIITPQEKLAIGGNIALPKTSGNGIKIDNTTPTFGWRDLLGDVFARNQGASKPTFTTYRGGLFDYQFNVGDEEYFKFHIPHDYVAGTDIFIHIHWSHASTTVTGGTVTFEIESSYAKGHNQGAFSTPVTGTYNGTASTTQYQHIISESQLADVTPTGLQIDTDDLEPDGVIIMRAQLNANNITVSGGGVPDPFIHYIDIHYQSTNIATKDKAPDFYA